MRRYLLDTPVLAALLSQRPSTVSLITPWLYQHEAATSILVYGEVIEYIRTRPDFTSRYRLLRDLLREIKPYFLTYPIMERYAQIRLELRPNGQLLGDVDTLIAASALQQGLTTVTTDTDFQRVPEAQVMLMDRASL